MHCIASDCIVVDLYWRRQPWLCVLCNASLSLENRRDSAVTGRTLHRSIYSTSRAMHCVKSDLNVRYCFSLSIKCRILDRYRLEPIYTHSVLSTIERVERRSHYSWRLLVTGLFFDFFMIVCFFFFILADRTAA